MQLDSVPDLRLGISACTGHLELKMLAMELGDLDIFSKPAKPSWQDSAMVLFVAAVTRRPACSLVAVFVLPED